MTTRLEFPRQMRVNRMAFIEAAWRSA